MTAARGGGITIAEAADAFLSSPRAAAPSTRRAYAGVLDRMAAELGPGRLLSAVPSCLLGVVGLMYRITCASRASAIGPGRLVALGLVMLVYRITVHYHGLALAPSIPQAS